MKKQILFFLLCFMMINIFPAIVQLTFSDRHKGTYEIDPEHIKLFERLNDQTRSALAQGAVTNLPVTKEQWELLYGRLPIIEPLYLSPAERDIRTDYANVTIQEGALKDTLMILNDEQLNNLESAANGLGIDILIKGIPLLKTYKEELRRRLSHD